MHSAPSSRRPAAAEITSPRNPRVIAAAKLRHPAERARRGLGLLEGPHLVAEARHAGVIFESVFATEPTGILGEVSVSRSVLERLASTQTPQSPVAVFRLPPETAPKRSMLVLWEVGDPGNVGTLIRSAAMFGLDVVTHGGADLWSPKTLRAGAGAHFHTAISSVDSLDELPADAAVVATVVRGGVAPSQVPSGRVAVLIGSEAHGLPVSVVERCAMAVTIDGCGDVESLNAAAAGSIIASVVGCRD